MLTFKQFIAEAGQYKGGSRTRGLTVAEAIKQIENNCLDYTSSDGFPNIMRGSANDFTAGLGDSNVGEPRQAANTYNYATLWLDNHEDWEDFPKRSRSFVCSSDEGTASSYGDDYHYVFPFNDAKIGVCPASDLFLSFGDIGSLDEFLGDVARGFREIGDDPQTYPQLVKSLEELSWENLNELAPDLLTDELESYLKHFKATSFYGVFEKALSPKGFKHFTPKQFKVGADTEIYVQGKAIFLTFNPDAGKEGTALRAFFDELQIEHG